MVRLLGEGDAWGGRAAMAEDMVGRDGAAVRKKKAAAHGGGRSFWRSAHGGGLAERTVADGKANDGGVVSC
ncbi:3-dehydroquinate dehydratase [Sesbania bispinosa]|nr:3-dehydroquinate dehydratase [Sesbania bispinosa]